jgi:hypothetical protein
MRPTTFESYAAAATDGGGVSCAVFEEKLYDLTRQTITLAKARRSPFRPSPPPPYPRGWFQAEAGPLYKYYHRARDGWRLCRNGRRCW